MMHHPAGLSAAIDKVTTFVKKETVLLLSWLLAVISAFLVPPDKDYLGYIDYRTIVLLFSLMAVMAGFRKIGFFQRMGEMVLKKAGNTRQLEGLLIFLCFFSSMFITNDVALITFVPFAVTILSMAGMEAHLPFVVVMQTIAANLGSILLPIGNPQNIFIYSKGGYSLGRFILVMLPFAVLSGLVLGLMVLFRKSRPLTTKDGNAEEAEEAGSAAPPSLSKKGMLIYGILFVLCLSTVLKLVPAAVTTSIVLLAVLLYDRNVLKGVDYALLLTFAGFFIFVGNLGRIPALAQGISAVLDGHEVITAAALSQVISNVPAALLLSGFTTQWDGLLVGVNIGGLGTLIASMASLISYKYIRSQSPAQGKRYFRSFTLLNLVFLALLLTLAWILR